jgi:hypothetical protein
MGMIAGPSAAAAGLEAGTLPMTATNGSVDGPSPGTVDCRRIGEHQLIELAKAVGDFAAIELGVGLPWLDVDVRHDTEIAVVNLLVVIVFEPIACCYSPGGF